MLFVGMAMLGVYGVQTGENSPSEISINERVSLDDNDVIRMTPEMIENLRAQQAKAKARLDPSLIRDVDVREVPFSNPEPTPQGYIFDYGFEDETHGDYPNDPPWMVHEEMDYGKYWGVWNFENETVGNNAMYPYWISVDGDSSTYWYKRDMEDAALGQNLQGGYFYGDDSMSGFDGFTGNAYVEALAQIGGSPAGTVDPSITGGEKMAEFNVNGDDYAYFGPYDPLYHNVETAYAGGWFYMLGNSYLPIILVDYDSEDFTLCEAGFYFAAPNTRQFYYFDDTGGYLLPDTWAANTWYELWLQVDMNAGTFDIVLNGNTISSGHPFIGDTTRLDAVVLYGATADTHAYIDNFQLFSPATGGSHSVKVDDTWSASGGTNSLLLQQNGFAGEAASATSMISEKWLYGWCIVQFSVRTDTMATTSGSIIYVKDFLGNNVMGLRFQNPDIQYYTNGAWVNTGLAYTATTQYDIEFWADTDSQKYYGIQINGNTYAEHAPFGVPGGGFRSLQLYGTPGTQATLWLDDVLKASDSDGASITVNNTQSNSGSNSLMMRERGANTYSYFGAYMGESAYAALTYHFMAMPPLGGGVVYVFDSNQASLVTIINMGSDIGGGASPGTVSWVDGDGSGGGWIISGPTISMNTWYNLTIIASSMDQTFDAYWNGAFQGTYGYLEPATDMGIAIWFGDAPNQPQHFYYDDIRFWIEEPPAPVTNLRVITPTPGGTSTWANLSADQDIPQEGTVSGTYSDTSGPGVQSIEEVLVPGSSVPTTETRYMRGVADEGGVAGHYLLGTAQSNNEQNTPSFGNRIDVYVGITVYVRSSTGVETEITSGTHVATASRTRVGEGITSADWNCPETGLDLSLIHI